eukprot:Blabericola_migrator_1__4543@NODE_2419_length_2792_cov_227_771743_g1515_i0_p1_GENE_NODE_2419_length_2792_cov_227_771743_g1515_i0NODE_2419_length_2792_cov_227_771743_g1515_i0_p1_ORF_typecomplete_len415_score43_32LCAT/PF02450_15/1_2e26Abhydrolase_6/PF12697_7/0_0018PGAP1/PF07819_13/5_3e02PGAP1/PF07819_13/0_17PGAP1/PF07819_13/2_9e02DUF915/PF06028_11/1_6e02DUF915/PF06028_11/0_12Ser_hydrolase/PF06821_13/0_02Lipase_2/PF01674_18/0_068Hydrolase_4/PF12146_8/0_059_NODE_2419_length_2792_cov_227_771743_g1515
MRFIALLPLTSTAVPVFLVPGFGGSGLEVRTNNATVPSCGSTPLNWSERAWISLSVWRPPRSHQLCWFDLMRLHYKPPTRRRCHGPRWECVAGRYVSREDVSISVYEGLGGVEYLDTIEGYGLPWARYFHDVADTLRKLNTTLGLISLHAFPYDWRLPFWQYPWETFKKKIEEAGGEAILIVHSMGGPATNWFLQTQVDKAWKAQNIKALISINGAFGGSMKVARALLSGYNPAEIPWLNSWGLPQLITNSDLRNLTRVLGSIFMLLPHEEVYNSATPILTMIDSSIAQTYSYSLNDWMTLLNDESLMQQARKARELIQRTVLEDPGVPTYCFWSRYDDPTTELYYVYKDWNYDSEPERSFTDGDGTLPMSSLRVCTQWQSTIFALEIPNEDHMFVLRSPVLTGAVSKIVSTLV